MNPSVTSQRDLLFLLPLASACIVPLALVDCLVKGQTENTFGKDSNLCARGQQIKACRTEISVWEPKRSQPRHRVCGDLSGGKEGRSEVSNSQKEAPSSAFHL